MSKNKQTKPIFTTSEFTIATIPQPIFTTSEFRTATIPEPKKIVGWYCLGSKSKVKCTAFGTYSKPNFIKRFFMRTLLDFYWTKETQQ